LTILDKAGNTTLSTPRIRFSSFDLMCLWPKERRSDLRCVETKGSIYRGIPSLFVWLVADGWCWFVLREKYCWLVAGGWFLLREKYCWLVADKPSKQGARRRFGSE
jgi:hypothetical protein